MRTSEDADRALVLGGGGPVGTAWMAGLLSRLTSAATGRADVDRIVGTSAGAIVGAALAAGRDLESFSRLPEAGGSGRLPNRTDPAKMRAVIEILVTPGLDRTEARRRAGAIALLDRDADAEAAQIGARRRLIGSDDWPDRLAVVAVDARTGERMTWDKASGVPLAQAVAASSAFPGASPPIHIDGRDYIDGGLRSMTNADLAVGAGTLVVVAPLAHRVSGDSLRLELEMTGAITTTTIAPDAASSLAIGSDLYDIDAWGPAYRAGRRQAATMTDGFGPSLDSLLLRRRLRDEKQRERVSTNTKRCPRRDSNPRRAA